MTYDERIFLQATKPTPINSKGLPPSLASLVVAQAAHETNNFTSNFFTKYNNAFGYTYAGSRYQSGPGPLADNREPIGIYPTIESSVQEIVDWIYRRVKEGKFPADLSTIKTPEQYARLLKDSDYYGDTVSNYTRGLNKFFLRVVEEIEKPGNIFLLLALGAAAFYYFRRR